MAGNKAPRLRGTRPRRTKGPELITGPGGLQRTERSDGPSVAEVVRRIGPHNHLCLIYETQEERFTATVPFLQAGLERGEKCFYIAADDNAATAVLGAARAQGVNVEAAIKSGTLTVNTKNQTYLKRGYFDRDRMISFLAESARAAKAAGYSAFRLAGEMTWMLGADGGERWAEYESKMNHFFRDYDASGVCLYDRRRFSPEVILSVIRTHPTVVYGGLVSKNPYYVPPDEFLKPNQASLEVERLLRNILTWERAEQALRHSEDRLRLVVDTIPTMAWSVRPDGAVDFLNQVWRDYTGLSVEEALEEPTRVMHPEDIPRVMEKWRAAMAAGEPYEGEMRLRRADGEYRWFLVRTVPLRDERGSIVKWYGSSVDIEDRKQAEESLRQLSARLVLAQEDERRRIARELHDATSQSLAALAINLSVVQASSPGLKPKASKALDESLALVEKCINEMRTISYLMHPPMLEELGLRAALLWYAKGFTKRSGIRVKLEMPRQLGDVSNDVALALYRVVQESLTNIHRHSGSRTAALRLVREPHRIILTVADRGRGMEPEVANGAWGEAGPADSAPGVGIQSMRERVRQLGGQMQIHSGRKGTTVAVALPLREERGAGPADESVS